jgi:hypothetical protein
VERPLRLAAIVGAREAGVFYYWQEVGRRMNIKHIPASYEKFEQFNINYEREHFAYGATNRHIADKTLEVFLDWCPRVC